MVGTATVVTLKSRAIICWTPRPRSLLWAAGRRGRTEPKARVASRRGGVVAQVRPPWQSFAFHFAGPAPHCCIQLWGRRSYTRGGARWSGGLGPLVTSRVTARLRTRHPFKPLAGPLGLPSSVAYLQQSAARTGQPPWGRPGAAATYWGPGGARGKTGKARGHTAALGGRSSHPATPPCSLERDPLGPARPGLDPSPP